jgi:integrase
MGKRITVDENIKQDIETKMFYVTFYYGKDSTGKTLRKTKTFKLLTDAKRTLKNFEVDRDRGNLALPSKITLNDVINNNLELSVGQKEETTIYGYRNVAKHIAKSAFGSKNIQDIKPNDFLIYFKYLKMEQKLGDQTIIKHYDFLSLIFRDAFINGLVIQNVLLRIRKPTNKEPHEARFYSIEQCIELLVKIKGDRLELLVNLAMFYGLRRSEILGLKWQNINLEDNGDFEIINVRIQTGSKVVERGHTKNQSSKRQFKLLKNVKELIENEKIKQEKFKALLKDEYIQTDYVFVMENGKPYRPNYVSELFTEFLKKNDLPIIVLHELRHTFASLSVQAGVSLLLTSKALGHADMKMAERVYVHLRSSMNEEATEAVEGLLLPDREDE